MARHVRLLLILFLILVGVARGEPAPDRALRAEASRHFKAGIAQLNEGNPNAALAEFEAAYALVPAPGLHYNIGLAQKALFRYPEAIAAFERFLADPKISGERRRDAEALIADMRAQIVEVMLLELPEGARVVLDGRPIGEAPLGPVPMVTGRHIVEVTADGYTPVRRELSIAAGMEPEILIPMPAAPKNCQALIDANVPSARVRIDGEPIGETPLTAKLVGGGHSIEVSAPGFISFRGELAMVAGQTRHVEIELQRAPKEPVYKKWWLWTSVGIGLTGGGVAAGFLLGSHTEDPYVGTFQPGAGRF